MPQFIGLTFSPRHSLRVRVKTPFSDPISSIPTVEAAAIWIDGINVS